MNTLFVSTPMGVAALICCAPWAAGAESPAFGVPGRIAGQTQNTIVQEDRCVPQYAPPSQSTEPTVAPFSVTARQGERAGLLPACRRDARFVVSSAESFSDIMKSELVAAAVRMSLVAAQEQMYRALAGHLNPLMAQLPIAGSRIMGRIAGRIMTARANRQHAFEFDFVPGLSSAMELSADSPVEFLISTSASFAAMRPVLLRADVLEREAIRVIAARKLELAANEISGYERKFLKVEKKVAAVERYENSDGTVTLRPIGPLAVGEYVLAFQSGDDSTFTLMDHVHAFRVSK